MEAKRSVKERRRRRQKPWARRRNVLLLAILLPIAGALVYLEITQHFSGKRYQARLDAIRAKGFPATTAELEHWRSSLQAAVPETEHPVPEDPALPARTASDLYQDAGVMDSTSDHATSLVKAYPAEILEHFRDNGTLSPEELAQLREFVAKGADILALLHEAAGLPPGRFPIDYSKGFAAEIPNLLCLRNFSRLLMAESALASLDGGADLAFAAFEAGASIQRTLRQEPILIIQMIRGALDNEMVRAFNGSLGLAGYSDAQLEEMQRAFASGQDPASLTGALAFERVGGLEVFDDPTVVSRTHFLDRIAPGSHTALVQTAAAVGYFDGDRDRYLSLMDGMIEASMLPYPEAIEAMSSSNGQSTNSPLLPRLSDSMLPNVYRAQQQITANNARLLQGETAAAIERYRLANGAPPSQLEDLVPAYLDHAPVDPFDLQPLRYRSEGGSYVLYSVGSNGEDDGGESGGNDSVGDLVFRTRP